MIEMHEDVRKGVTQSKESEKGANWLFSEILIIAVISGIYFSSWWVFGGVLLGASILMVIKPIRYFLLVVLSLGCGVVGWIIGQWFDSLGASVVIAIIATLASGGAHIYANKWMNDV
ncbi:hypothetical protein J25TS5_15250 [Paenibacillus faecis]|uniref:hypothetical protein n=1 Tax=Paenibacillus faecis TaxID=862114 RepID=UPI001B03F425|nr:hypothetical protein [Paenibacillus faecis]GIO84593.1 hypothetical protein J25TS5_15250 [Paenibacillus faecis]